MSAVLYVKRPHAQAYARASLPYYYATFPIHNINTSGCLGYMPHSYRRTYIHTIHRSHRLLLPPLFPTFQRRANVPEPPGLSAVLDHLAARIGARQTGPKTSLLPADVRVVVLSGRGVLTEADLGRLPRSVERLSEATAGSIHILIAPPNPPSDESFRTIAGVVADLQVRAVPRLVIEATASFGGSDLMSPFVCAHLPPSASHDAVLVTTPGGDDTDIRIPLRVTATRLNLGGLGSAQICKCHNVAAAPPSQSGANKKLQTCPATGVALRPADVTTGLFLGLTLVDRAEHHVAAVDNAGPSPAAAVRILHTVALAAISDDHLVGEAGCVV